MASSPATFEEAKDKAEAEEEVRAEANCEHVSDFKKSKIAFKCIDALDGSKRRSDRYGSLGHSVMVNACWQQSYDIALQDLNMLIQSVRDVPQGQVANLEYVGIAKLLKAYEWNNFQKAVSRVLGDFDMIVLTRIIGGVI